MLSFKSFAKFAVCAGGAGAVAAGAYYVHKRGDEEQSTEAFEGTPVDEDPVQRASSGFLHSSDGHKDTQMDEATPEGSLAEAEEKKEKDEEKDEVSGVQLNSEELYVLNPEHRVMELEKLLCEAHRQSEMKSKECEQERQAHRVLMVKYDEVKEVVKQNEELRKECERERQAHSIIKKKYDEMKEVLKKYEELLKSSLAEADERANIALESSALLEHENCSLKDQVKTLEGSVEKLEGKLHETHRMCIEMLDEWEREREGQDHSTVLSQFEDTKVYLAETEKSAQNVLESSAELEHENSDVMHQEQERERKDYCILWSHYENTKSSLAEAEERAKIAVESNAQLEYENSILMEHIKTLQGSVEKLEGQLCETHKTRVKLLKNTLEQENSSLKDQVKTLEGSVEKLETKLHETHRMYKEILDEWEQEREGQDHSTLMSQFEDTKVSRAEAEKSAQNALESSAQLEHENSNVMHQEQEQEQQQYIVLWSHDDDTKFSLTEAEVRAKIALESSSQLEDENSILMEQNTLEHENSSLKDQVKTLQCSVEKLEGKLHETHRMCKEISNEQERERQDYCILWSHYENTKSSLAEAEERAKIAVESNAQLEYENSILMEHIKTLQGSVEKLEGQLCETHKTGVKLLKNTLEQENSSLKDQVKTLQASVEKLEGKLHETHRVCKEISNEQERERQDYSILWSHYENTKSSLAEAEERAKIALESNAQLEYENSILMEHIKTLQGSVEKLEGQLCETHKTRVKLLKNTLEQENSSLKDQVKTLQSSVEKLEGKLHETHRMSKEISNEREGQDHSTVLSQFEDTKVSIAEAEKSAQNALESSAQVEHENSDMVHQGRKLSPAS